MEDFNMKISIVITFYNSVRLGNFVERSMNCLLNQTYKNIEYICVNDGSTDSTLSQLEDYAKKDSRIKVINKENEGVAHYAKAAGQDAASGDYIMLFDHDDELSLDAIELAVAKIKQVETNIDAVSMIVNVYYPNGELRNSYNLYEHLSSKNPYKPLSISGSNAYKLTVGNYDFHFRGLIKKEKFKAISFRFPEKIVNGDEIIERQIFKSLDQITSCEGVYHHYIYDNSSAKSYNLKKTDFVRTDVILREIYKTDNVYEERKDKVELFAYKNLISGIKVYHHFAQKLSKPDKDFYINRLKEGFKNIDKKILLKQYSGKSKWYNSLLATSFFVMFWYYKYKN